MAAAFVVFGTFWGGWAVVAADVEAGLGLSHGGFGTLLSFGLAAAAVSNVAGGALAERFGTARVLCVAFAMWSLALVASAAGGRTLATFAVPFVLVVALGGLIDVTMNVAATSALAGQPGRLVRFHALFNVGAAAGAASAALAAGADVSWRWLPAGVAVGGVAMAALLRRRSLPAGEAGEHVPLWTSLALLRRGRLLLLAAAFAVAAMVEGGVEVWGVLLLRTGHSGGLVLGGSSAVAGYLVAAASRAGLGPMAGRQGAARGVAIGATIATVGILVLSLSASSWMAGAGLVLAAGGISMCWPLLLSVVAGDRARPGAIVGAVTSVGYLGFVVGPSVVGWLAGASGLRGGLVFLAGAAAFVAIAPLVSGRRETDEASHG